MKSTIPVILAVSLLLMLLFVFGACTAPAAGDVVVSADYTCDEATGRCGITAQLYETPTPAPLPTYTPWPTATSTRTPQPTATVLPFYAQIELGADFQVYMGPESTPVWHQVFGPTVQFVQDHGILATMLYTATGVYRFEAIWLRDGQPYTATIGMRVNDPGLPKWTIYTDELGVILPTVTPIP